MLNFRQDMIQLSLKYPFITKVIIDEESWSQMCVSFDNLLGQTKGETENHIDLKQGSMRFEKLHVEKEKEDA
ncbi:MAG: hypothetical protein HWN81_04490 [Candidatus Lokiarchaeota archaeon]|nr:hypothetical protein [Candidatus Lokiarchaeota archaeon]